jgi:nicotinamidase-related amidase
VSFLLVNGPSRAAWLAAVANELGVPAVITEEDPEINGPTDESVLSSLPVSAPVFTKTVFGLADCPDIMAAVRSTGRRTALLTGFETDACVTHSAVGLGEAGYRGVIVEDAVYSPFGAHVRGITRLRDLGFELIQCESVYYDWIRTLPAAMHGGTR